MYPCICIYIYICTYICTYICIHYVRNSHGMDDHSTCQSQANWPGFLLLFVGISWDYSGVFYRDLTYPNADNAHIHLFGWGLNLIFLWVFNQQCSHLSIISKCPCCWLVLYHASPWYSSHYIPTQNHGCCWYIENQNWNCFPMCLMKSSHSNHDGWWYFLNFHPTCQFFFFFLRHVFSHLQIYPVLLPNISHP